MTPSFLSLLYISDGAEINMYLFDFDSNLGGVLGKWPDFFTELAPLGRFSHIVTMSECLFFGQLAPSDAVFYKASHWP